MAVLLLTCRRSDIIFSLAACLPPTPFQAQAQALAEVIPRAVDGAAYWAELVVDWLDLDLSGVLAAHTTPEEWRAVFPHLPTWQDRRTDEAPQQLVIYTDGSAATRLGNDVAPAAWAFAVWLRMPDRLLLLGFAAHTTVPLFTPFSLGETADTPLTAELLAIAWALLWAIEFGAGLGLPIEFRYDCTSAGGGVFGCSRLPGLGPTEDHFSLASFTGHLRLCLENRASIWHTHVKGHAGDPGNELCDCLAKWARLSPEDYYSRCLPSWPHVWWSHPLAQWGWLAGYQGPDMPCLTALEAEAARLQAQIAEPLAPSLGVHQHRLPTAEVTYAFEVISFNILTMFDPGVPHGREKRRDGIGLMVAGKRDLLKRQLFGQRLLADRLPRDALASELPARRCRFYHA